MLFLSYVPGLSRGDDGLDVAEERHRVNSQFVARTFSAQIAAIVVVVVVKAGGGLGVVDASRCSQLLAGAGMAAAYLRCWHGCGGAARFPDVPAAGWSRRRSA